MGRGQRVIDPRLWLDVALHAVVMEAYVLGVATRKVDGPVTAWARS